MGRDNRENGSIHLLILEDNKAQLQTLTALMQDRGFQVVGYSSALDALEHLAREKTDVAIVDLRLPDVREDELLDKLRGFADEVSIIVNTGYGSYGTARNALNIGAFAYVEKAGDPDELVHYIHRAIETRLIRRAETLEQAVAERTRELQQANEAAQQQLNFQQTLIDAIPLPVFFKDIHSRYLGGNSAFEELIGKSEEQFVGKTVHDQLPRELADIHHEKDQGLLNCPGVQVYESQVVDDQGTLCDMICHKATFNDATGRTAGLIGTFLDVTTQREMQQQMLQSQKMEAIGHLAGGVAHDFRNQLTVIQGWADLLQRDVAENDNLCEMVGEILKAAERSTTLTGQLLAFSRKEILQPQVSDVTELIWDFGRSLARVIGEDIELHNEPNHDACRANIDPGQFQQAIVNLAVNARDAMPVGGALTIRTDCVPLDDAHAERPPDVAPGKYVVVHVEDTGVGMNERIRSQVFEPFFTTKDVGKGTGLGLSMVYGFVAQSGGFVECKSQPAQGTRFALYFPAVEQESAGRQPEAAQEQTLTGTETVLVVEDEEDVRHLLTSSLRRLGYRVIQAAEAVEAFLKAEEHDGAIDMLITDVVMPGMNGTELARRLRKSRPDMVVLYASGYFGDDLTRRGVEEAGAALLTKPFSFRQLGQKVRQLLDARQTAAR